MTDILPKSISILTARYCHLLIPFNANKSSLAKKSSHSILFCFSFHFIRSFFLYGLFIFFSSFSLLSLPLFLGLVVVFVRRLRSRFSSVAVSISPFAFFFFFFFSCVHVQRVEELSTTPFTIVSFFLFLSCPLLYA